MPLLQWWSETAKAKGLSQEEFDKGVEAFVNNEISSLPNQDNERELLGENATQRIEAADLWSKKIYLLMHILVYLNLLVQLKA